MSQRNDDDAARTREDLLRELGQLRVRLADSQRALDSLRPGAPGGSVGLPRADSERFMQFADSVGDAFLGLDADLRCTHWNGVCERLCGVPAQEAAGRSLGELFPHFEGTRAEEACLRTLRTGRPGRVTVELEVDDGQRDLELTICPCDGGICVLARDVTDRVRAEQALRQSEARYRMLLEDVPAVTYAAALDEDATPIYMSPQAETLMGHPPEAYEADPTLWLRQVHPEDRDRILAEAAGARAEGQGLLTEYRVIHRDGRIVWFRDEAALVRDPAGRPIYWQGVAFDITDRKLAEEALRESEERYRMLVEMSPDAIVVLVEERIAFANRAAAAIMGLTEPSGLLGRGALDLVRADFRDVAAERLQRAAVERISNPSIEMKVRKADGADLDVESVSLPVTYRGRPAIQVIFRDVTERKAAEEKLRRYREALRSLASRISQIEEQERRRVASALHDHIAQTLALSKIRLGLAQEQTGEAQTAQEIGEVRQLIQKSLDYARSLVFDLSPPILYEMGLEAALAKLAENLEKDYGIQTQFEDDGQPKPLGDDVRTVLFQAARELLVNAAKHAGPCRVKVFTGVQGNQIAVRVEDDGAGFDASGDALRVHESGGFGLFNVRERLDQLGGRLELRSQPGRGTIATLLAPLKGNNGDQRGAQP